MSIEPVELKSEENIENIQKILNPINNPNNFFIKYNF